MIEDLTPDQRLLAEFMSDLSEEAYYAGWMANLEYALWEAAMGLRRNYGHLTLTEVHCSRLRELSNACGGWVVFDDATFETWLPRAEWERRFATWAGSSL